MDAQPLDGRALLHLVDQVGVSQQCARHRHERKALAECSLDRVEPVDSAQQDQWHVERLAELARVGQEVRLLEWIRAKETSPEDPYPETDDARHGVGHLAEWDVATEEVHRVLERAAPGELERVERAVGL